MAKRKREEAPKSNVAAGPQSTKKAKAAKAPEQPATIPLDQPLTLQIVAGSYDGVLHGVTATIPVGDSKDDKVEFADTFLFNAHSSAMRCVALSPPTAPEPGRAQKVMLATGSTDERINVYSVSAYPPKTRKGMAEEDALLSSVAPSRRIVENRKNREVGTLMHHASTVTHLAFPTRSKLISSADDSTIAVTRTRDWSLLSSIKAPVPKAFGRPSGDTAPLGGTPSGVNDFAVHPSMKLMVSVSKGERCMRLWNLMTAKKAGVLNFSRDLLQEMGEGRHSTGEGRRAVWGAQGGEDEFAVAFDRNALVFGMDSRAKCKVLAESKTKVHEIVYIAIDEETDSQLLAISTEDGRILFVSTRTEDLQTPKSGDDEKDAPLPTAKLVAQIGGKQAGITGRIKDFALLRAPTAKGEQMFVAAGSSDGKLRVFQLGIEELKKAQKAKEPKQTGKLLGAYDTQNRITCLEAFVMIPRPDGVEDSDDEFEDLSDDDEDDEDEEE